jgi:hypothetical protein
MTVIPAARELQARQVQRHSKAALEKATVAEDALQTSKISPRRPAMAMLTGSLLGGSSSHFQSTAQSSLARPPMHRTSTLDSHFACNNTTRLQNPLHDARRPIHPALLHRRRPAPTCLTPASLPLAHCPGGAPSHPFRVPSRRPSQLPSSRDRTRLEFTSPVAAPACR